MGNHYDKIGVGFICEDTGKTTRQVWTDHKGPGNYNSCEHCAPEGYRPLSHRLYDLNESRKRK